MLTRTLKSILVSLAAVASVSLSGSVATASDEPPIAEEEAQQARAPVAAPVNDDKTNPLNDDLPDGVVLKDGVLTTTDGNGLSQEDIDYINMFASGCYAFAFADSVPGQVFGTGEMTGSCSGHTVCADIVSSTTGYVVDGPICANTGVTSTDYVRYYCSDPECGILRARVYNTSATLVSWDDEELPCG